MNRSLDAALALITLALIAVGLVMVFSASATLAEEAYGTPYKYLLRQAIAVSLGSVLGVITALTPTASMRRYGPAFLMATCLMLVLTYVPGAQYKANGAARWIGFGSINVQPSEFAKIAVLVVLADYLDRWRGQIRDARVLLGAMAIPAIPLVLTLFQPDFGTTAIMGGLCGVMLFVAGLDLRVVAMLGAVGALAAVGLVVTADYRMARVTSFMDPWSNQSAEGYHIIQSWVAMHSGGLDGQGLGNSIAKLHFLPEPWTDFIGAVIAEEFGFLGIIGLVLLFSAFVWRGLTIAVRARDAFGMYLASTLTLMIGLEAVFNLCVIMGLVPPKGLVLPFISYGASAMFANLWGVGILLSIAAESREVPLSEGWPGRRELLAAR